MAELADVVDAEVVDESTPTHTTDVAVRQVPTMSVAPQVEAAELGQRLAVIKTAMEQEMKKDVDYGVIPGTSGKPSLFKPGAEKLSVLFQLDVQLENVKSWGPGDHLTVESRATVFHAPSGQRLGFGEGLCTTREKKYGKRRRDRLCPECGEPAVLKSNDKPEWFCWRKKGGCGKTFPVADPRLANQEVGEVENPELPDTWNTVIKMAEKRARIDAILAVTGASALFTQDVEDFAGADDGKHQAAVVALPYGPPADDTNSQSAVRVLVRLCGDDAKKAQTAWAGMVKKFEGKMPEAAALAIRMLGPVLAPAAPRPTPTETAAPADVPWSPDYQQEQIPTADEPADAAPAASTVEPSVEEDFLEDRAIELWTQLEGPEKALARVNAAGGVVRNLRNLIKAAESAQKAVAA